MVATQILTYSRTEARSSISNEPKLIEIMLIWIQIGGGVKIRSQMAEIRSILAISRVEAGAGRRAKAKSDEDAYHAAVRRAWGKTVEDVG